jgi:hypothetical protein
MRISSLSLFAVVLFLGEAPGARAAAPADGPDVNGSWKVVILPPFQEVEFMIVKLDSKAGKFAGTVTTGPQGMPQKPAVIKAQQDAERVVVVFDLAGESTFDGSMADDGVVRGTFTIQDNAFPARLEKATDTTLNQHPDQALMQQINQLQQTGDPKAKVEKLTALAKKNAERPNIDFVYMFTLGAAEQAGMKEAEVQALVDQWLASAKPYGAAFSAAARLKALAALSGKKPYAGVSLGLANALDKEKDLATEKKAEAAHLLAAAAKLAGKADVVSAAEAKAAKLDAQVDEEYHTKVPPFKPEADVARKDKDSDRVVLLELFTGAQCPPCVAADVAFDGLLMSYGPKELIGLQYHLHIPGPDPLTNKDTETRAQYYSDLRGTPSTYFNGKSEAGGGGGMGNSKGKYNEYRAIIDGALAGKKRATIDLKVTREGKEIKIAATAQASSADEKKPACDPKDDPKKAKEESKLRLRLALVEDTVRYVGGNKLRFHHHVVRAMPGGAEGASIRGGEGKSEVSVDLDDLRKGLEQYLSDYAKQGRGFAGTMPVLKLENLAVVAFIQDDSTKEVLHAQMAHVK